jgi:hypothetical protein
MKKADARRVFGGMPALLLRPKKRERERERERKKEREGKRERERKMRTMILHFYPHASCLDHTSIREKEGWGWHIFIGYADAPIQSEK